MSPVEGAASDASIDPGLILAEAADADIPTEPPDADVIEPFDAGPPPPPCKGPPGLYRTNSCNILADNIREYRPKYELWSDGADKFRHIYLPPGSQIDTSDPDRWTFPIGTRVYKTFVQRGVKVETRMLEKITDAPGSASWNLKAYAWSADQMNAPEAPVGGVVDALGTKHDIPSQMQCGSCHTMANLDPVNGFSALQLNHLGAGLSLGELLDRGMLVDNKNRRLPTITEAQFPGDAKAQNALGYLHANCGHCHGGPNPRAGLQLWTTYGTANITDAPIFMGSLSPTDDGNTCACLTNWRGRLTTSGQEYTRRVVPGHAEISAVVGRMSVRTGLPRQAPLMPVPAREQMPPLGTETVDVAGVIAVSNWINSLDLGACDPTVVCPPPPPAVMMTTATP